MLSKTHIRSLALVLANWATCQSVAQPVAVELTPHRYELALTLDEFSVFHGAASSGVERYNSWAEFDVRIDGTASAEPVWTITIEDPRMLEVWQQWMAQSTTELVGLVDFDRLDQGSVGALAVTQSVNAKVEAALASPIWDSSTVAGTLLVERREDGSPRVVLVPLSGGEADTTGPASDFEPRPLVLTGPIADQLADELAATDAEGTEVLAAGPIKAYGYMELTGVTERLDDTVEIFVMSQCPYGVGAMTAAIERVRELERRGEPAPDLDIRYIFYEARADAAMQGPGQPGVRYTSMKGEDEVQENLVQMAIRDEHGEHYFDYLLLRSSTPAADWSQLVRAAGLDASAIESINQMLLFERDEMIAREHAYVAQQRGVTDGSPTWSFESRLVAGPQDIPGFEGLNVQAGGCAGGH